MVALTIRWFSLDGVLTAETPSGRFALGAKGWGPVSRFAIEYEARPIDENTALEVWAEELAAFGAPPSGIAPRQGRR